MLLNVVTICVSLSLLCLRCCVVVGVAYCQRLLDCVHLRGDECGDGYCCWYY